MLRRSALAFRASHPGECPTVDSLIEEHFMDHDFRSLGVCSGTFEIQCQGDDVSVSCRPGD